MKSTDFIEEDRLPDDPDIHGYETTPVSKKDDTVKSVAVFLKGKRSAFFTRIARRFETAAALKKELAAEEKALKDETRKAVDELFDAGDEIYTRVVETASLVFKIAKAGERTKETFDEEAYLTELAELTGMAVDELQKIKEKHITTVTSKVAASVLAPKEKKIKKESIHEGVMDKVNDYVNRFTNHISNFLNSWDNKFEDIKTRLKNDLTS